MLKLMFFALLLAQISLAAASDYGDLWVDEVDIKSEQGKDLILKFEEIERQEGYSIVRFRFTSGASVPSIMFMVKGFYTIAKQRGRKYFVTLQEWKDPDGAWMYKEGFVDSKDVDLTARYSSDIKAGIGPDAFLAVEDYDAFWGTEAGVSDGSKE